MVENNEKIMKDILEGPYDEKSVASLKPEQKTLDKANHKRLQDAFKACMNETAIKATGIAPMKKLLDEFEKLYPVAGTKGDKDELTTVLVWLAQRKFSDIISVTVQVRILAHVVTYMNLWLLLVTGRSQNSYRTRHLHLRRR
jgi:predicted metalloendopeptidase